jgi:hypothetical protein
VQPGPYEQPLREHIGYYVLCSPVRTHGNEPTTTTCTSGAQWRTGLMILLNSLATRFGSRTKRTTGMKVSVTTYNRHRPRFGRAPAAGWV